MSWIYAVLCRECCPNWRNMEDSVAPRPQSSLRCVTARMMMTELCPSIHHLSTVILAGRRRAGANPSWHWVKGGIQHGQGWHLELKHHTHSHSHISGQFKVTCSPNLIVFGLWEEAGLPRGNPSRYWENIQTTLRKECTSVLPSCVI